MAIKHPTTTTFLGGGTIARSWPESAAPRLSSAECVRKTTEIQPNTSEASSHALEQSRRRRRRWRLEERWRRWRWRPLGPGPSGGGGGQQPDLEELLKRSQDRLKQVMGGAAASPAAALALDRAWLALAAWALSGFYTVRTNEVALNMVFGKFVPPRAVKASTTTGRIRSARSSSSRSPTSRPIEIGTNPARDGRAQHEPAIDRQPQSDGRREYRRHRLFRAVAHLADQARGLRVQQPEPATARSAPSPKARCAR